MNFGSEIIRDMFGSCAKYKHLRNCKVVNIARNDNYNLNIVYDVKNVDETVFFVANCEEYWHIGSNLFYDEEVWCGNRFYFADFGIADILSELNLTISDGDYHKVPIEVWNIIRRRDAEHGLLSHRLELLQNFLSAKAEVVEYQPFCKCRLIDLYNGTVIIEGKDLPDFTEETLEQVNELIDNYAEVTSFCGYYQITKLWHNFADHKDYVTYAFINEEVTKAYVITK